MARQYSRTNPLGFTPWPVTIITALVYLALVIPLLVVQHVVPSAPGSDPAGLNLTEAWADLQVLTNGFHPYNSHRNDDVHKWLLQRVHEIIDSAPARSTDSAHPPAVFVFDDDQSNLTFSGRGNELGVYFESTNILVYIRGTEDDETQWWADPQGQPASKGGVLVNAHYDSVSTGYGATDDGMGVVSCLQLLRYFTTPGHAPRRGLVVLLNNGEEDFLNGARVYSQHPLSRLPHTFVNLEGAGAGGRASLFRSSDTEVTRPYARAPHPFGSVLSANGFEAGLISSQTDYVVLEGDLGLRGLDIAFIEPRARYHTDQDDARHTSVDSLWHMLSAAVATTEGLVDDASDQFDGAPREDGKVASGSGSKAVWFDLFGSTLAVFELHTLFALSVTLLIVAPLVLLATSIALVRADRMYLFRSTARVPGSDDFDEGVSLQGVRGFFRFPFLLVIPTGVAVGLAYLVTKINPYIIHSSEYAVWSMMISAWVFLAWFVSRVADFARPSAFHRVYVLTWMFVAEWVLLVIATVYENRYGLAGGYFVFFALSGTFLATWISYLELFALPRKSEYARQIAPPSRYASNHGSRLGTSSGEHGMDDAEDEEDDDGDDEDEARNVEEEPTESTSLLRGRGQRTTFANYVRVTGDYLHGAGDDEPRETHVYGREQAWSAGLPKWTWVLQFLLSAPIVLILVGPLALLLTAALRQTAQDGSSPLFVYIAIAVLTTLLVTPLLPFIHRYTHHIPLFLLLVFTGTLIYNLVAFPFSPSNRLKLFFLQEVDLDTGVNRAFLSGAHPFVYEVARSLPSAAGQNVSCDLSAARPKCSWYGIPPQVQATATPDTADWVSFNITRSADQPTRARFSVAGQNTRACRLVFDDPVRSFAVLDSAYDPRFPHLSPQGTQEIRLWSREWGHTWTVDVEWTVPAVDGESRGVSGRVVCLWSDGNAPGVIPALDEVRRYSPVWTAVSKLSDGLVEGSRRFEV
ncbi:M28 family metallopeptidase [Aspergillus clavatus NRRL 1]|uniref:Vacuolar membrane protease n=1 Tax=Aspergillus clavatus (strain ATCC 1007 / CBS 513.65 / DSM 816 / NCTC 3887 / NRRL 1 / QM 1276 / 107) TaxID=344612 RepID=PFF1_ASPCL|nr:Peptidase family M28 family [Aspergillus clavatus NRRL 1]A1CR68.1 RecName: Full=Vacuolar membrane protease; AltName: Full=FXNA-related family protease 1 [Aspergillus clavatus NRRL 1]EAW08139.1 Peptidase family M28 family [Aspergillus clavatus NRRL 1]